MRLAHAARRFGLPLFLALAFVGFGELLSHHYPVADWLFPRYALYWLLSLLFGGACLSSGHLVVTATLGRGALRIHEHLAVAFAVGVYVFFVGVLGGGLLGLFGGAFFFALPLALIAAGAVPLGRYLRRAHRHLRGAHRRARSPSPWGLFIQAFGLLALGLIYFSILTPNNAAFDARWQHLGLAEHYAAAGAVQKLPEGSYVGAAPQLASILYTWAFLLPKGELFDRIELAAHLELTVFAVGLVGITALVRRLVRPSEVSPALSRYAWVARFLFPGVLLYDSSLCLGADHIASIFAVPIFLLLLRAWKALAPRACALLALVMAAALAAKYTAALLLVTPALVALPLRVVLLALRRLRNRDGALSLRALVAGPLVALGVGVVAFAPHWLKDLVWYGDPLYPVLHARFHGNPWTPDAATRFTFDQTVQSWHPERNLSGALHTLSALFTFSFVPNDWDKFHGHVPVFGSLFTLSLGMLLFLPRTRRLWGLFAAVHVGLFAWYWVHHQDRYLQTAMPWMAAATAGVLARVWAQGLAARIGVGALLALQIVWGGDVYFMPAHPYVGVPAKAVIDLLSHPAGHVDVAKRAFTDPFVGIGRALPPKAKPLIHESHPHLGIAAPSVTDCPLHQGGISYALTPSPREVWAQLTSYGVTHLVFHTAEAREPDTLAGELVFFNFAQRYGAGVKAIEGWNVAAMPKAEPPAGDAPDPVLVVSCPAPVSAGTLPSGLYHLADLRVPSLEKGTPAPVPFQPGAGTDVTLLIAAAAIAQDRTCPMPTGADTRFTRLGTREPYALWIRK